jgi:16S rRNA (cytosine967-C5)-methyltransferase
MIAPARLAAFDALQAMEQAPLDLGEAVARVRSTLSDERDRGLLLELVAGTLRMRRALDFQIGTRVTRPLASLDDAVLQVLRLSAFQLIYLSRLPPAAVISDAVDLTRRAAKSSAAGLVNAVLRALSRERNDLTWPDDLSVVHSHPAWLVDRWLARVGRAATEAWLQFNNRPARLCLAANPARTTRDALARELSDAGVVTEPTPRAPHGLYVVHGHPLQLEAFTEGRFVVQDEASQLVAEFAAPAPGARLLDLCASPGGKTVSFAAAIGHGRVVACDVRPHRLRVLARTVRRCRLTNVSIVHVPATGALPFSHAGFDLIVIDAPCSGLGTIRRDPDIRWRRSLGDLPRFAAAQLDLLARAADLVLPAGRVIYSTCSSEPDENTAVVEAFLASRRDFALEATHETLPFRDGLEAFYGAALRRVQ